MSAVDDIAAYLAYLKAGGNRIDQIIFDELPNGEEMTATDELRRLLDERGVAWTAPNSCLCDEMTSWAAGGFYYDAFEVPEPDGTFLLTAAHQDDLTPEQAVDATLGRGTCRQIETEEGFIVCSECGAPQPEDYTVYYCWCCGRKVVDA